MRGIKRLGLRNNLVFNCVMLALMGVGVGLVSLLIGAGIRQSAPHPDAPLFGLPMFWSYFESPVTIILNLLPPVILIFLVYFISNRAWAAFLFPSLFIFALSAIHFFKMQIRGDPLVAADAAYIREAGTALDIGLLTMNWKIYLAAAALAAGAVFSAVVLRGRPGKARVRIIGGAAAALLSALLYSTVYTDTELYTEMTGGYRWTQFSASLNYSVKGFIYPFLHSIQDIRSDLNKPPEGFNPAEARAMLESYGSDDIPEEKKVNIIAIMLEAYSDFSVFGAIDLKEDVYGPLHRLQSESVCGMLVSNVFGGGTIDTERLFLTGNTRLTNYNAPVNSYVRFLNDQGYHTEGFTAVAGWFYDRAAVNRNLGFSQHYFLEDYENSSQEDSFFFDVVKDLYETRDRGRPYFSFNVSAQNHSPYPYWEMFGPEMFEQGGLDTELYNSVSNYLTGIQDTTQRLERFIDSLRDDPEPVAVIVFGDHMPMFGSVVSTYYELGINFDRSTEEGFYNFYSTPYLIWANNAARAAVSNDFIGGGGSFSPGFLMGELFSQLAWDGEGYMKALNELKAYVDVINTPSGVFRENGVLTLKLSPQASAVLNRHRIIEFYRGNFFVQS